MSSKTSACLIASNSDTWSYVVAIVLHSFALAYRTETCEFASVVTSRRVSYTSSSLASNSANGCRRGKQAYSLFLSSQRRKRRSAFFDLSEKQAGQKQLILSSHWVTVRSKCDGVFLNLNGSYKLFMKTLFDAILETAKYADLVSITTVYAAPIELWGSSLQVGRA